MGWGFHAFPKGINLKVNVIAKLEILLAYDGVAVRHVSHYTTGTTHKEHSLSSWKIAVKKWRGNLYENESENVQLYFKEADDSTPFLSSFLFYFIILDFIFDTLSLDFFLFLSWFKFDKKWIVGHDWKPFKLKHPRQLWHLYKEKKSVYDTNENNYNYALQIYLNKEETFTDTRIKKCTRTEITRHSASVVQLAVR